jgi:uncharacterized protein (TIGR02284 family)
MTTNDDMTQTINELIAGALDGEYGFRASAEFIHDPQTKQLFLERAQTCANDAAELRPFVAELGGNATEGGSAGGAMHRGWVAVKATLSGYSDRAILDDAQRAEDKAIFRYQCAMNKELLPPVRTLIERLYLDSQRHLTLIKALLEREQAAHH